MDNKRRGKCLIFAHSHFLRKYKKPIPMSEKCIQYIESCFKGLEFEICKYKNLTMAQIAVALSSVK